MQIPGYDDEEKATALIQEAKDLIQKYEDSGEDIPQAPVVEAPMQVASGASAKSQADQMLKEQMAALTADETSETKDEAEASAQEVSVESSADEAAEEALPTEEATAEITNEEKSED